jgi:hypothetical protein
MEQAKKDHRGTAYRAGHAFGTTMRLAAAVKKVKPIPHVRRSAADWDRHSWRSASGEEIQTR